jgi:hypothetical protein
MRLNPTLWQIVSKAISDCVAAPQWLYELGMRSWFELLELPVLNSVPSSGMKIPSIRKIVVTNSYVEFLDQQVRFAPRGPSWAESMQRRLVALRPRCGEELLQIMFFNNDETCVMYLDLQTGAIVDYTGVADSGSDW